MPWTALPERSACCSSGGSPARSLRVPPRAADFFGEPVDCDSKDLQIRSGIAEHEPAASGRTKEIAGKRMDHDPARRERGADRFAVDLARDDRRDMHPIEGRDQREKTAEPSLQ